MNVVLGVERMESEAEPSLAASLLKRMRFPQAVVDVVRVVTPLPYGTWGMDVILTAAAIDAAERAEKEWAEEVASKTAAWLRQGTPLLPEETGPALIRAFVENAGEVSEGLIAHADREQAGLIVIDGPHSGPMASFLTGSVSRSLVISSHNHSLLLAKDLRHYRNAASSRTPSPKTALSTEYPEEYCAASPGGPVRAVFATDHSPYANRCLRKLVHLAPAGISHLTVMSAYPEEELAQIGHWLSDITVKPATAIRHELSARNEKALQELSPLLKANGATSESRVIGAPVNEAIARTMDETGAELLILGAQGHSFMERLTLGSVSFHQAMTAPYSLLILRA